MCHYSYHGPKKTRSDYLVQKRTECHVIEKCVTEVESGRRIVTGFLVQLIEVNALQKEYDSGNVSMGMEFH